MPPLPVPTRLTSVASWPSIFQRFGGRRQVVSGDRFQVQLIPPTVDVVQNIFLFITTRLWQRKSPKAPAAFSSAAIWSVAKRIALPGSCFQSAGSVQDGLAVGRAGKSDRCNELQEGLVLRFNGGFLAGELEEPAGVADWDDQAERLLLCRGCRGFAFGLKRWINQFGFG